MHQISFPGLGPASNPGASYAPPNGEDSLALRTISISAVDRLQVNDQLQMEYSVQADSVSFLQRETRMSPFARADYDLGAAGMIRLAFSSGAPPPAAILNGGAPRDAETSVPE